MTTADLERRLSELGGEIAYPATPDLARVVRARIRPRPAWRGWRQLLVAAAVLLVALAASVTLSPDARRAVAGFLGLPGFQIQKVKVLPLPSSFPGFRPVTIDEARRLAGFTLLRPGPPERLRAVGFDGNPPGGEVELDLTGGAIVTEVKGGVDKIFFGKMVGPDGQVTEVTIGGSTGYWFSGAQHVFFYTDASGKIRNEDLRLAGDTLVFERGGVLVRIEGAKNEADAVRLAGLLH